MSVSSVKSSIPKKPFRKTRCSYTKGSCKKNFFGQNSKQKKTPKKVSFSDPGTKKNNKKKKHEKKKIGELDEI